MISSCITHHYLNILTQHHQRPSRSHICAHLDSQLRIDWTKPLLSLRLPCFYGHQPAISSSCFNRFSANCCLSRYSFLLCLFICVSVCLSLSFSVCVCVCVCDKQPWFLLRAGFWFLSLLGENFSSPFLALRLNVKSVLWRPVTILASPYLNYSLSRCYSCFFFCFFLFSTKSSTEAD